MILISLKDGKKISLNESKTPAVASSNSSSSSVAQEDSFNSDDEEDEDISSVYSKEDEKTAPTRKRQRLTHLSYEEKLQRRKLKNRIAAQSARDRKKNKFDTLEDSVRLLRDENEQLRVENSLLKEKTQLLIEENRKLLEYKKMSLLSLTMPPKIVSDAPVCSRLSRPDAIESSLSKRKLSEYGPTEVESAAFNKFASQPKKQFQSNIIQKLICVLIVYTMSLIGQVVANGQEEQSQEAQHTKRQAMHQVMPTTTKKNLKLLVAFALG